MWTSDPGVERYITALHGPRPGHPATVKDGQNCSHICLCSLPCRSSARCMALTLEEAAGQQQVQASSSSTIHWAQRMHSKAMGAQLHKGVPHGLVLGLLAMPCQATQRLQACLHCTIINMSTLSISKQDRRALVRRAVLQARRAQPASAGPPVWPSLNPTPPLPAVLRLLVESVAKVQGSWQLLQPLLHCCPRSCRGLGLRNRRAKARASHSCHSWPQAPTQTG